MTYKMDRVLSVKELARVEREGALYLWASGDRVEEARLDIYEPPRFFEAFRRSRAYTEARLGLDDAELTRQCERAIRNYDPYISCSAHFLDLTVERSLFLPNGAWYPWQVPAAGQSW